MAMGKMTVKDKAPGGPGPGDCNRITIEMGDNGGASLTCSSKPAKAKGAQMMPSYEEPKTMHFSSVEEAFHAGAKEMGVDAELSGADEDEPASEEAAEQGSGKAA